MNVYIICTGNTCRSPMAEAILRARKIQGVEVRSAGIHTFDGVPISEHAEILLQEKGMPYTKTSNTITEEDVEWADLIVTMTEMHKRTLKDMFPHERHKIHTLKGYLVQDGNEDVHDPFGGTLETYEQTFEELSRLMEIFEQKLKEGW